jgi:hypothetical protein
MMLTDNTVRKMEISELCRIALLDVPKIVVCEEMRRHGKTIRMIEAPAWKEQLTLFILIKVVLVEILFFVPICEPGF